MMIHLEYVDRLLNEDFEVGLEINIDVGLEIG